MKKYTLLLVSLLLAMQSALSQGIYTGQRRALCILMNFSNIPLRKANIAEWQNQLNGVDYKPNKGVGSVHDYFYDMSYGQFDLQFDILSYTVSNVRSSYAASSIQANTTKFAPALTEALKGLYADGSLTDEMISQYDWDGDGDVEQIVVIFAGPAGQNMNGASYIRSHESELKNIGAAVTLGGKRFSTYAACAETRSDNRTIDGIGGVVHEMIHCFGIPDFYGTHSSDQDRCYTGMDSFWDVMDEASYNGDNYNGTIPPQMTAFERWQAGWLQPIELNGDTHVTDMLPMLLDARAYVIYNKQSTQVGTTYRRLPQGAKYKEFFLIENRKHDASYNENGRKWDSPIGQFSGLLVVHVDFNENEWNSTLPNANLAHQRMTIVPADGNLLGPWRYYIDESLAADVWSSGTIDQLTVFNGPSPMLATLSDITVAPQGVASFRYSEQSSSDAQHPSRIDLSGHVPAYDLGGRHTNPSASRLYIRGHRLFLQKR